MGVCGVATELMAGANGTAWTGFEGFEKRLELEFYADPSNSCRDSSSKWRGLRAIGRVELNKILTAAQCTIVSELSNDYCDSYVLSESSLFVYPLKIVLKTCGTTQLLLAIPPLLAASFQLHLTVKRCKYTRGTFMFPSVQLYPHGSFNDEVRYLQKYFGHLGSGGKAYVMGTSPNWHIYMAAAVDDQFSTPDVVEPTYTVEVCMTDLDRTIAHRFFNEDGSVSGLDMTKASGIDQVIPHAKICDFAFNPCGYSMNALEGKAHTTIHVTPEDGYSYASFESMGYGPQELNLQTLLDRVARVFKPARFSVSVQVNGSGFEKSTAGSWGASVIPQGYACDGTSRQEMPSGNIVVFHTFQAAAPSGGPLLSSPVTPLALFESHQHLWLESELLLLQPSSDHHHNLKEPTKAQNEESSNDLARDAWKVCSRHGRKILDLFSAVNPVALGPSPTDMDHFIRRTVAAAAGEDPFYVMDMGLVLRLWRAWEDAMPRVKPFYAVKCNRDTTLLSLLAKAGAGFDVASKVELAAVMQLGVSADRVIYANPCKLPSHIRDAAKHGVLRTTFDSETELFKLSKYHPTAEVVLRIRADDAGARCPLGVKYGADLEECEHLLAAAKAHGLKVVGVAFHVGSGAAHAAAFAEGIAFARSVFDMAAAVGLPALKLLDVGGGFVSKDGTGVKFESAAAAINEALDKYFPTSMAVDVIAEPGRYFAEEAFTLATHVFGSRMRSKNGTRTADYWVNDGIYGSMNCLLYDHATLSVRAVCAMTKTQTAPDDDGDESWPEQQQGKMYKSTVFGPTCDGLDTIMRDIWLPELRCGDWLVFPRMGAYTKSAGSSFNGFELQDIGTVYAYSCEDNNSRAENNYNKLVGNLYDSDDAEESDSGGFHPTPKPNFQHIDHRNNNYSFRNEDSSNFITLRFGGTGGTSSDDEF